MAELWPNHQWIKRAADAAERVLANHSHGDLPRWSQALQNFPPVTVSSNLLADPPELGTTSADPDQVRQALMAFHPWRKGPLKMAGVTIDTEWRSDWKWNRVSPHVNLAGARVLDVGCGNGYFGLRMLADGARLVVGVDPTLVFVMQWQLMRRLAGDLANFVLPLRLEDLPEGDGGFDAVLSMGVLYHRKDHLDHLQRLHGLLRPGGTLVLETLVLPQPQAGELLVPEGRYARMRNVWAVPGLDVLQDWIRAAGFQEPQLVNVCKTGTQEQRSTDWMQFESLDKALNPEDPDRTVEGHPAPVRAVVVASRA